MTDFLSLKGMQVLVIGQQKLLGSPSRLQGANPAREHVLALGRSPTACAACSAAESAVVEGTVVITRHSDISLRRVLRPMVILYGE